MADTTRLWELLDNARPTSRREFLKRASILGVSMPIFGSLLVACGGDDEDEPETESDVDTDIDTDDEETEPETEEPATDETEEPSDDADETETPDDTDDEDEETNDTETEESAGEGQYGGRIVAMGHHAIESLHPDDTGQTVAWTAIKQMHNSLVDVDENYEIENELAESYEFSDDGMELTVQLRDDVTFHDGEQFTSEDVQYTYEWYMDEANAAISSADFGAIDSITVEDDFNMTIGFAQPDSSFLRRGMIRGIVPEHYHSEVGYETYSTEPIGTGPFKLVEWVPDDHTLMEANEDYFDGRPYVDEFEVRVVPEPSVRAIELESGGADTSIWTLGTDDDLRLVEDDTVKSYVTAALATNNFPMNNTFPQFDDKRVRQALMFAIDRQDVIDRVFAGAAALATANLASSLEEWYEPDVPQYTYDPDRARELLEEAGWVEGDDGIRERDGERLEWECFVFVGDEVRRPEAEMVAEFFREVGADMSIREIPAASSEMRAGTGYMALHNWTYGGANGEPDARDTLSTDGGNNFNWYSNPEMDELLAQGVAEVDPGARREIYSEVQKLFAEDVPMLFMMNWDWFNHYNQRIKGLPDEVLAGSNLYRKIRLMWIEE